MLQRARQEVVPEGEPGVPDSKAGGDMAPSGDADPPKPERKGPEMPRLFLDLGPPQGNSEQIKGERAAGSLGNAVGGRGPAPSKVLGAAEMFRLPRTRQVSLAVRSADCTLEPYHLGSNPASAPP